MAAQQANSSLSLDLCVEKLLVLIKYFHNPCRGMAFMYTGNVGTMQANPDSQDFKI